MIVQGLIVIVLALGAPAVAVPTADGAMFRERPERTGVAAEPGPVERPTLRWRYDSIGASSPVLAGDTVYLLDVYGRARAVADGVLDVAVSGISSAVVALDAASVEERWRIEVEGDVWSSSAVATGRSMRSVARRSPRPSSGASTPTSTGAAASGDGPGRGGDHRRRRAC